MAPKIHRNRLGLPVRAQPARSWLSLLWILALCAVFLAGCGRGNPEPTRPATPSGAGTPTPSRAPEQTPTPAQPSPTPVPLAASVNGEGISLEEYQAELARYTAASGAAPGTELAPDDKEQVLDNLVNEVLLAQAAAEEGFTVDGGLVSERFDALAAQLGGPQALQEWLSAQNFTEAAFRQSLARSVAAAWMRDRIIAEVPSSAEQVEARQLLFRDRAAADEALARLNGGVDFDTLAAETDPVTGGYLGWFPAGYLPDPQIAEAAFKLQPGQFSPVIQTSAGFHIIQVIERDPQHSLSPDARLALQLKALQSWLEARRSQSTIEIFVS